MYTIDAALLMLLDSNFDVILVETVGVGQSELAVADLVDIFILLVAPGVGDELQVLNIPTMRFLTDGVGTEKGNHRGG